MGQNLGTMEVKRTKSSILRPICHLEHCKSINDPKNGFANKTIQRMYFAINMKVIGALRAAKEPKLVQNEGQIYKIVDFEANFPFETL